MDRRTFLTGTGAVLLAAPLAAIAAGLLLATPLADAAPAVPKVGYLSVGSASDPRRVTLLGAFQQGLRDLGYIEGKNILVEVRFADGDYDRIPALAAELVRLKVDIIVAYSTVATQAAQNATRSIPIVMTSVVDPVTTGLVANLGQPGANVTGLSLMAPELVGKQLQLLKELVPKVDRWLCSGIRPTQAVDPSCARLRRPPESWG
jgi:ABC-type uncharacterized transport system substrate-binding protein